MSVWVRKRLQGPGVGAGTSDRERPAEGRSDRSLVYGDNGIWVERNGGGGPGRIWKMVDTGGVCCGLAALGCPVSITAAGEDAGEHSVLGAVLASEPQPSERPSHAWQEPKPRQVSRTWLEPWLCHPQTPPLSSSLAFPGFRPAWAPSALSGLEQPVGQLTPGTAAPPGAVNSLSCNTALPFTKFTPRTGHL